MIKIHVVAKVLLIGSILVGLSPAKAMFLLEINGARSIVTRKIPSYSHNIRRNFSTTFVNREKPELIYNKAREQWHYYIEHDDTLKMVEKSRPISKEEISQTQVIQRFRKEQGEEIIPALSSYKMPTYEKNKENNRITERILNKKDGRIKVDPSSYPMYLVGKLNIVYLDQIDPRDGSIKDDVYIGTGFLVDKKHVLTAGHNIFYFLNDPKEKWRLPDLLLFYPGYSDGKFYINGKALDKPRMHKEDVNDISPKASIVTFPLNWQDAEGKDLAEIHNNPYDFGAFILDREIPSINPYFYPKDHTDEDLCKMKVAVTGHPVDKNNNMYTMEGQIREVTDWRIHYSIDTHGGQSGSPVWYCNENNMPICTGVHIGNHHGTLNTGTRLTNLLINYVQNEFSIKFDNTRK